jgi:hypothetical protein
MTGDYPGPAHRRSAEIVFTATVRATELRFRSVPTESVEFTDDAAAESTSGSVRTNLPDEVTAHTTYRDIQVDYAIAAKLATRSGGDR